MLSLYSFSGAIICASCAISNAINLPFAPVAAIAAVIGAVFCAIGGIVYWGGGLNDYCNTYSVGFGYVYPRFLQHEPK